MRRNGSMTSTEAVVLACVYDGKPRTVAQIHRRYNSKSRKPMAPGSVHSTLRRMEKIGLIEAEAVKTEHPHGGADRNIYVITDAGREKAEDVMFLVNRLHYAFRYNARKEAVDCKRE